MEVTPGTLKSKEYGFSRKESQILRKLHQHAGKAHSQEQALKLLNRIYLAKFRISCYPYESDGIFIYQTFYRFDIHLNSESKELF
jgi:hypothetical protein